MSQRQDRIINQLLARCEELQDTIDALELDDTQRQMQVLQSDLDEANERVRKLEGERTRLRNQRDALRQNCAELRGRLEKELTP